MDAVRGRLTQRVLVAVTVMIAAAATTVATAPPAWGSIGQPSVTLSPSTGTAGSTANLGVDIKFSPTGGDTTKDMTLQLPPGLIANAAVDGGACLKTSTPTSACQVGSGTVTATENELGIDIPLTLSASFDLVAPPSTSDLAGLAVLVDDPLTGQPTQLGTPAAVTLRPSGNPAGIGLDIAFSGIPDSFDSLPISLDEINSTFDGLRFPSSCPATPAKFTVSADSYQDATVVTASAPLTVTGCSALPFSPAFTISATRDTGDVGTQVVTDVSQTAAQATTSKLTLALPAAVIEPDAGAVLQYNLICANPASGTCRPIGSAVATSPLYPAPLTGTVYLTGTLLGPAVSILFPPPFPITLSGTLDVGSDSTTFTGIPDIPLTNLNVTLDGGPAAAFLSTCQTSSGTATASLTTQNGDRSVSVPSSFTVANCVSPTTSTGSLNSSGSGSASRGPAIQKVSLTGLAARRPALSFRLVAGKGSSKLSAFTVRAPAGLRFTEHKLHGRQRVSGVSVTGAKVKSVSISRGQLVVTLRKAVASLSVKIGRQALSETAALQTKAKSGKLKSLGLTVIVRNAAGRRTTLGVKLTKP